MSYKKKRLTYNESVLKQLIWINLSQLIMWAKRIVLSLMDRSIKSHINKMNTYQIKQKCYLIFTGDSSMNVHVFFPPHHLLVKQLRSSVSVSSFSFCSCAVKACPFKFCTSNQMKSLNFRNWKKNHKPSLMPSFFLITI